MAGLFFEGIKMGAGRRQHVKRLEQKISSDVELNRIGIDFGLIWRGCTLNWLMQEHKGREIAIERKWDGILIFTLHGEVNMKNLYQSSVRPHGPHVAWLAWQKNRYALWHL